MEEGGQEEPPQVEVEAEVERRNGARCLSSTQEEEGAEVEEDRRKEEPLKRSPNPYYGAAEAVGSSAQTV